MTRADASRSETSAVLLGLAGAVLLVALWALRDVVILLSFALLLAYVLDPLVSAIERVPLPRGKRVPRAFAAAIVIVLLLVVLGWSLALAVPRLLAELGGFVERAPGVASQLLDEARAYAAARGWSGTVDPAIENLKANAPILVRGAALGLAGWLGRLFSGIGQIVGLTVLPLLAYYLLAEREAVRTSLLQFVPDAAHDRLETITQAVDRALRSYVRGQAIVCLIMGATVGLALLFLGFPLVLLLAVMVAIAEVVPVLGALVAMIAIALVGYSVDAWHAVAGVIVYAILNNAIGMLVTPRVMSRYLKMHPFVITVSVLTGGRLLGPAGVMLALPGAAVVQSLIRSLAPRRAKGRAGD